MPLRDILLYAFPGPSTKFYCTSVVPSSQAVASATLLIVTRHSYVKFISSFVRKGQPTCALEWEDGKDEAILKGFFCAFMKECKLQIHRAPQSKLVGRALKTSDVSSNIRVMES